MSLTLNIKPNYFVRVYDTNTAYYKIVSTSASQENFRYMIKLYDPNNNYLSTIKLTPDANGYGWYNPTSYIKNFLTSTPPVMTVNTITKCTNSFGLYTLNFGEEYGDPIVQHTGLTSDVRFYYNGCQIYENYDTLYGNNYWIISTGGTIGNFLNTTDHFYLDQKEHMWLYWISKEYKPNINYLIQFYDNSNTFLDDVSISITVTGSTMYNIGCGPMNIKDQSFTIPAGTSYYTCQFLNGYYGITNIIYIYLVDKCDYYDFTQVYWLNEHGGWSNFLFNKKRRNSYKITRDNYDKFLGYGYNSQARGLTQYQTEIEQTILLSTDNINDYQNNLIKSLMFSPDVRIWENNTLEPYIIIDTDFNEYTQKNDKVFNYQIKLVPATSKIIQYG